MGEGGGGGGGSYNFMLAMGKTILCQKFVRH